MWFRTASPKVEAAGEAADTKEHHNLARMNMLRHRVKDLKFDIFHGDILLNEWDMMRDLNPAKKPLFDAIVANPLFILPPTP